MTDDKTLLTQMLKSIDIEQFSEDIAHVEIHGNKVLGLKLVKGLKVESESFEDGINVKIIVEKDAHIKNPVRFCFGMIPENGIQKIIINTILEENSSASFIATCTFPNAKNIQHLMDANITLKENSFLNYFERHIHGPEGGVTIVPKTMVFLNKNSRFNTEFELIKGSAGIIDLDYEAYLDEDAVVSMTTRIFGRTKDDIKIKEKAHLKGDKSVGVLTSHIALKDESKAEIINELIADGSYSRGHVDCKEIIQGSAKAKAIPIVTVNNKLAHITHEAAIGSVDSKQLETLLCRGLTEDEATDLIIDGLLK
ncbi:MAG TPA: SufD family Fe-S cluster assembly protein [Exilispira sp.]|nr:SufD family Fe-S cluster assembly protein [Exilispira sp.]